MHSIIQRLGALGWTEKDMDFLGYEEEKAWLALVEVAKPLTERIWSNLLPKLTSLLEENRRQNIAERKKRLSYERSVCFGEFFSRLRFKIHQFEPILEALGMGEPCRPNPDGPGALSIGASWKKTVARMDIVSLFPKTRTMLAWDCLSGLDEPDMTAQEVYKNLAERRPQVEQRLSEWRASVEEHLVEIFESGGNGTETNAILTVKGSTDSTQGLGRNSRLLLRADTIFKRDRLDPKRSIPCHYPDFVSPCSGSDRDPYTRFYYSTPGEIDLNLFSRDTGMEKIVKVLLKDLGMPDVAYLELRLMERSFVCGRCKDGRPRKWDDLAAHYIQELEDGGFSESTPRHSGMVLNVHNLDLANNSEPLVLILEQEETGSSTEATNTPSDGDGELYCYICNGAGESEYRADREDMLAHLQDVHEVTQFVEGFYYGTSPYQCLEWEGEWDDFRDACEIKAAAILALES
ncbi:hypothetical protein FS749_015892 [Ceratobasidium sp. UAMH 11750]|nr:hypothetical protein FS749_015892 [Ceratobasidium sp. UAMH 11750]